VRCIVVPRVPKRTLVLRPTRALQGSDKKGARKKAGSTARAGFCEPREFLSWRALWFLLQLEMPLCQDAPLGNRDPLTYLI